MDINLISKIIDYGIIGLLAFMALIALFFWVERLLYYRHVNVLNYKTKEALELDITKHTSIISSFAANAPYIGLLGTVMGIIITFYTLGESGNMDVKNIMGSLSLALKATAMGLIVAIPAIFFYNHLSRRIDVFVTEWKMHQKEK